MATVTLKLTSLLIRTLSKPVSNYIKRQSREHPKFRKICINFAQSLHRIDMRMRLGLLQDPAVIERQIAREAEKAAEKRRQALKETSSQTAGEAPSRETPYDVPTETQSKAEDKAHREDLSEAEKKVRKEEDERRAKMKIRPLSEAKAIDSGANFISEAFLFAVAGGLILFESWRSKRKEGKRRDEVKERLEKLEEREEELEGLRAEVLALKAKFTDGEIKSGKGSLQKTVNAPTSKEAEDAAPVVEKGDKKPAGKTA